MIPISIVIKGLYSYQEEQSVDFEKLLEGQLFGIFGSVGSGKSSILEAIAFALYGETERMNRTDNRSYNMMNLKSDELWIDFQFKNYDEAVYRFTVRGKRHGKDFAKVGTYERKAYKKTKESWEPLEVRSAEEVIGLSYVNFRRTIIIPQGKFQEFLQLGDKSRTDMLREIFDLSKFEFFMQTASLDRKNKDTIQNLHGQLQYFETIESSSLEEKEITLKQLNEFLAKQQQELNQKRDEHQKLSALKRQFDQKDALQRELEELLTKESEILTVESQVQEYEYCLIHFKDKLNRKVELESTLRKYADQLQSTQQQAREKTQTLTQVSQELEQVQKEYLRQDEYKEQLADYETILRLHALSEEREFLQTRIKKGEEHVENATRTFDEKTREWHAIKARKKEKQALLPDIVELANLRVWFDRKDAVQHRVVTVTKSLNDKQSEVEGVLDKVKAQLSGDLLTSIEAGSAPDFHLPALLVLKDEVLEGQKLGQRRIDHYRLQTKLGEFTSQLKKGEPCMLCGSTTHSNILLIEDVEQHLNDEEAKLRGLKEDEMKINAFIADLSYYREFISQSEKTIQSLTDAQKVENSALQEHLNQFTWSGFSPDQPAQLEKAFKEAKELQEQIKADEKLEHVFEEDLEKLKKNLQTYEKAVGQFIQDNLKRSTEYDTLKKGLKRIMLEDYEAVGEAQLNKMIIALKSKIESTVYQYERCIERRDKLSGELIGLKERGDLLRTALKESEENTVRLQEELQQALESSSFTEFEVITRVLNQPLDIESLKNKTSNYRQKVYSVRKQIENLTAELGGQVFDKEGFALLELRIADGQEVYEREKTRYIREQSAFEKEQADFNKKKKLLEEMTLLLKRENNLNILKKLFKGSGFVNYISSVYLQNLCFEANKRFYKLTNQQLQLEIDANNNFQVRDFLNNGRVRSVKTLSGGQTFQASLSLALALAESVQQQNKSKQNFFFLDEGFGSLDRESLQTALTTLKTLRKENRMVGVISHVEDLQQEIDVYLTIKNDSMQGSLISGSWQQ